MILAPLTLALLLTEAPLESAAPPTRGDVLEINHYAPREDNPWKVSWQVQAILWRYGPQGPYVVAYQHLGGISQEQHRQRQTVRHTMPQLYQRQLPGGWTEISWWTGRKRLRVRARVVTTTYTVHDAEQVARLHQVRPPRLTD